MKKELGATKSGEMVRMDQVPDLKKWWLWPERIPTGNLTLLAGDQDAGKSRLAWDLAARVSRGDVWPDGETNRLGPSSVLLVSSENHLQIAARPALMAAGADMAKVMWAGSVRQQDKNGNKSKRTFDLRLDLDVLESMIIELKDCRMVIIDSISAYLGSGGGAKTAEFLRALMDLAARYQLAVVGVTHLRKGNGETLHRVVGGLTLTTAARCIWALAAAPESRGERGESRGERRLFLPVKNNLATGNLGLAFWLHQYEGQKAPRVEWSADVVEATADEAFAAVRASLKEQPKAVQEAMEYLKEALRDGPRLVKELEVEAKTRGISQITLRRARIALEVRKFREQVPGAWWVGLDKCGIRNSECGSKRPEVGGQTSASSTGSPQASSVQGEWTGRHGDAERGRTNGECGTEDHVDHLGENAGNFAEKAKDHVEHVAGIAVDLGGCRPTASSGQGPSTGSTSSLRAASTSSPLASSGQGSQKPKMGEDRREMDGQCENEDHVDHVGEKAGFFAVLEQEVQDDPLLCGAGCGDSHETGWIRKLSVLGRSGEDRRGQRSEVGRDGKLRSENLKMQNRLAN